MLQQKEQKNFFKISSYLLCHIQFPINLGCKKIWVLLYSFYIASFCNCVIIIILYLLKIYIYILSFFKIYFNVVFSSRNLNTIRSITREHGNPVDRYSVMARRQVSTRCTLYIHQSIGGGCLYLVLCLWPHKVQAC